MAKLARRHEQAAARAGHGQRKAVLWLPAELQRRDQRADAARGLAIGAAHPIAQVDQQADVHGRTVAALTLRALDPDLKP